MNREAWLNKIAEMMAPRFAEVGYPLPKYRLTVGFTSKGKTNKVGGQCWSKSCSDDDTFEIIIGIGIDQPQAIACILCHELIHAAVGLEHGHKGEFARIMKVLGMKRPFTASIPGDDFIEWVQPFIDEIGPIPHAKLNFANPAPAIRPKAISPDAEGDDGQDDQPEDEIPVSSGPKKQGTRLIKVDCEECGFLVRMSQKWIDDKGFPHCPEHGAKMGYADGSRDGE